jgi:hypothetical protein
MGSAAKRVSIACIPTRIGRWCSHGVSEKATKTTWRDPNIRGVATARLGLTCFNILTPRTISPAILTPRATDSIIQIAVARTLDAPIYWASGILF